MVKVMNHAEYQRILRTKSIEELRYIARDASEASRENPAGCNAGYYLDEVNYATMEMARRGYR